MKRRTLFKAWQWPASPLPSDWRRVVAKAQDKKFTIALIPGLTTDAFYITMRKGAEAAAKAVGRRARLPGRARVQPGGAGAGARRGDRAPARRHPDRADRQDAAHRAAAQGGRRRHPGDHRRHLHRQRQVPDRRRRRRLPALLHRLRQRARRQAGRPRAGQGASAAKGKVYVSNVKPGISTTDQREEGFKAAMQDFPGIEVLETQFNDNDANKAASQLQAVFARNPDLGGVFGANLFSALGAANGVQQAGQDRQDQGRRLRRADLDRRQPQDRPRRPRHRPASGRDRLFRRRDGLCRT